MSIAPQYLRKISEHTDEMPISASMALTEAADEIERLVSVVTRLGSSEAFDISRSIDPIRDRELLARMDYARDALKNVTDGR